MKKIAAFIAVVIVAVLGFASTRPDTFRVERSMLIKAPPDKVFALINDFHQWEAWSPWAKRDPAMKATYSGAAFGNGATYEWSGNREVGAGRMEILDAAAPTKVSIKLDFMQPIEGHNTAEFTLAPHDDSTTVTWAMFGPSPFIAKVMGLFCSMDSIVGKDFEQGLSNLKGMAEK